MPERIYIGNLSYNVDEKMLTDELSTLGFPAQNVKVVRDRDSGEHRGFGFADVTSADDAMKSLNGQLIGGRAVRVDRATEKAARPMRGGGDRRGERGAGDRRGR